MKLFIWNEGVLNGGYSDGMIVVLAPNLADARELAIEDCPKLKYDASFNDPNQVVDLDDPLIISESWIMEGGQ